MMNYPNCLILTWLEGKVCILLQETEPNKRLKAIILIKHMIY